MKKTRYFYMCTFISVHLIFAGKSSTNTNSSSNQCSPSTSDNFQGMYLSIEPYWKVGVLNYIAFLRHLSFINTVFLADLKNQPIGSSCVTHILPFCSYFKGQEQICFNPTSWHLVTYNFLRGHKFRSIIRSMTMPTFLA